MLDHLLPLAYAGLKKMNINPNTAKTLLTVIEHRTKKQTGAQWSIANYRKLKRTMRQDDALLSLTKCMHQNQETERPVHEWPQVPEHPNTHEHAYQVGHIMSTRLFTVYEDDLAEIATQLMIWKDIHHVPVENKAGEITGILTWTHLQKFLKNKPESDDLSVGEIMARNVILSHSEMPIKEAILIMKQNEVGCLPVVHNQHLIGIVTIKDIIQYDQNKGM